MNNQHHHPHTEPAPETTGVTLHWAGHYDFFTSLFGLGVNSRNSRMVVELAGVKPGDRVLDVGCGTGNLTLTASVAAGAGGAVYGIDAAPEMIQVARGKAKKMGLPVTFEVGLVEKLPFPDGSFDIVLNRLMVHHLPDDLKVRAFHEVFRVLRPGGHLLIADFKAPENHLLAHLLLPVIGHRMMHAEISNLPPMLSAAGFVDVSLGPTRSALLAFVRARKPST
jgi:demethylmenaquinone methyltransferase/2-methoxy-6-polyprenyl-1,4-benzoquinol methylase/phosphoethanolamine N-methyltransferase